MQLCLGHLIWIWRTLFRINWFLPKIIQEYSYKTNKKNMKNITNFFFLSFLNRFLTILYDGRAACGRTQKSIKIDFVNIWIGNSFPYACNVICVSLSLAGSVSPNELYCVNMKKRGNFEFKQQIKFSMISSVQQIYFLLPSDSLSYFIYLFLFIIFFLFISCRCWLHSFGFVAKQLSKSKHTNWNEENTLKHSINNEE